MNGKEIIFYLLAAFTLVNGFLAVTSNKIFRSAIYLLFSLIGIAGFYFWLEFEFVAAVQIVVYVGGIVVLIIFSIFLTQQAGSDLPRAKASRNFMIALATAFGFALTLIQIYRHPFVASSLPPVEPSVANIGEQMLGVHDHGFALPFEIVSILLLAAMIGCIVIAIKAQPERE